MRFWFYMLRTGQGDWRIISYDLDRKRRSKKDREPPEHTAQKRKSPPPLAAAARSEVHRRRLRRGGRLTAVRGLIALFAERQHALLLVVLMHEQTQPRRDVSDTRCESTERGRALLGSESYLKMFTDRAVTSRMLIAETADSEIISSFARRLSGIASVGLNAIEFVKET